MKPSTASITNRSILFLLPCILFQIHCPQRPPDIPPAERIDQPGLLIKSVSEQGKQLNSFRATGSIVMRKGTKRLKAHIVFLTRRPSLLRFETESFFDQPLSILVSNGMDFSLWDMDEGRFLVGKATPANISRVIPIPMDGPEVVGILRGEPPWIPFADSKMEWIKHERLYLLTLSNSTLSQKIWIHPIHLRPTQVICRSDGKLLYRLIYQDWTTREDQWVVPKKILFEMPSENIKMRLKVRDVEINPSLDDKLFVLEPPQGIPVESIETTPPP